MKEDSITDPFYLQIQKEIDRIERKADQYIWMFYVIRITQIIFTGIITILAGISKIEDLSQAKTILILEL